MYKMETYGLYFTSTGKTGAVAATPRKTEVLMHLFQKKKKTPTAMDILKAELDMTKAELETAYSHFENVVDPDLISSSIYHINAVQERYKYLMKLLKTVENETKTSPEQLTS